MPKQKIINKVLSANNFPSFNPMQEKVGNNSNFNKSLVVSSPTASGKTVVAELFSLYSILVQKKKVIYTCPLRALASEHFRDFKKKYSDLGIRFTVSTGDFDSTSKYLSNYDLIFTTYEKLDSLLRHRADWLSQAGLLVVDEVHELDSDRGATLEMVITKMRSNSRLLSVLALSATIPNAKELADWLEAGLVESDYRPVKLEEGVQHNGYVEFPSGSKLFLNNLSDPIHSLTLNTLSLGKQQLVFANTRKRAESIANQLAPKVSKTLSKEEIDLLEKKSKKILSALEQPTEQCKKLASLVKEGVAFHHAGLVQKQKTVVEDSFRENLIKLISSTPTLAAGVNLPAHTVAIPSLYRYTFSGMQRIPVREYKQMVGRAGRPKYDKQGRGIVFAKNEFEAEELMQNYVLGELEEIQSKLGIEPVLRTHLLALIASNYVSSLDSAEKFFSKTFFAKQFSGASELFSMISDIIAELSEIGFVESNENSSGFKATALGNRVSELYLDPISAKQMIDSLPELDGRGKEFAMLFSLSNTFEFAPWVSVRKNLEPVIWEMIQERQEHLPINLETEMYSDPSLLQKFYSALLLEQWVEEKGEQDIMKEFNVQPGILHAKLMRCDWLAYSLSELARLTENKRLLKPLHVLRKRLKHGVKEELVMLTEVRGIGRVRARRLWRAKIRSVSDLKKADEQDLARVVGAKTAVSIKKSIGQK